MNWSTHTPDDELDGLLRAFFRAETPDPWPVMKAPAETLPFPTPSRNGQRGTRQSLRAVSTPRRPLWRSRLALAASVALLVGGALFLPGAPLRGPDASRTDAPGGAPTADTTGRKRILGGGPEKPGKPPARPMGPMDPPSER